VVLRGALPLPLYSPEAGQLPWSSAVPWLSLSIRPRRVSYRGPPRYLSLLTRDPFLPPQGPGRLLPLMGPWCSQKTMRRKIAGAPL
jgi:hypothetical protein